MSRHREISMLVIAGLLGALATAPARAAESHGVQQRVAVVRAVVREADGTVVRAPTRAVPWGQTAAFELTSDDHQHELDVTVDADAKVELDYVHDGMRIDAEPAKQTERRAVYRTAAGVEIVLTITSTRARVEAHPG